jgi:hypothetical protein
MLETFAAFGFPTGPGFLHLAIDEWKQGLNRNGQKIIAKS